MLLRTISLGPSANSGGGQPLRDGGLSINRMFAEISRQLSGRWSPRDYGAFADGASHTVGTVLGISTLATLAAYVHPDLNGATPYSWITSGLWVKSYKILPISVSAANGATVLTFTSTTGVAVGQQVRGNNVPAGTTVSAVTATTVTLSAGLTAAKAAGMKFAFVAPLTDADVSGMEMDSLALQSAIQLAKAAGGGAIDLGFGTYLCDNTIILPESGEFGGQQVNLEGPGHFLARLRAKTDFGAGRYLLSCGDPLGNMNHSVGRYAFNYYEGYCRGFRVEGPTAKTPAASATGSTFAFGTGPAAMNGIAHGSRREWREVWAWYFDCGWSFVGDHSLFSNCLGQYCRYGGYFDDASASLYGDQRFEYCFFMGNGTAGLGVSKNAMLNGLFIKPYLGGQPYSIVGEAGTSDDYGQPYNGSAETPLIQGSTFTNGQWEWAGNGSIVDLNGLGGGARSRPIVNTVFQGGYWSWDTGKAISGRGQNYYFDVGSFEGVRFEDLGDNSFDTTAGQLAMIRTEAVGWYGGGLEMVGALDTILAKYATVPFLAAMDRFSSGHWRNIILRCKGWVGHLGLVNATAAIPAGTVIEASSDFQGVRPATGTTAFPLVGVVVGATAASAGGSDRFIVYAKGDVDAKYGTGSIPAGVWVKSTADGLLQPATGPTDGQVVGWVWHDNGGGSNNRSIRTTFPG